MEEIMPVDSAFTGGTIELSHEAGNSIYGGSDDAGMLADALVIVSVMAIILSIRRLVDIIPSLLWCMMRWKEALNLEYSIRLSRSRDIIFFFLIIPFCLAVSRYGIYSPEFMDGMSQSSRILATIGIIAGYIMLRIFLEYFLRRKSTDQAIYEAACKAFLTFFCTCTLTLLATAGILSSAHLADNTIRQVLIYVICAFYLLLIFRKIQIFSQSCNVLTTILYLCTLEILPTGLLVVSAIVL